MSVKNRIGGASNAPIKQRLGVKPKQPNQQLERTGLPTKGDDARFRLIQKKRQKIKDARDRLAEIAKSSDARLRLNKIKNFQAVSGKAQTTSNGLQKTIVRNVAARNRITNTVKPALSRMPSRTVANTQMKKIVPMNRTGIASAAKKNMGMGGKAQLKSGALTRTVNRGPQIMKQTTNVQKKMPNNNANRYHPLPNNPNVVTIKNAGAQFQVQSNRRLPQQPQLKGKRYLRTQSTAPAPPMRPAFAPRSSLPARNDIPPLMKVFNGNAYNPYRVQPFVEDFKPARLKITTANNYMAYEDESMQDDGYMMRPSPRMPNMKRSYDDYDGGFYASPPKRQPLSSDIIARLNQGQGQGQQVSAPIYRVLVTNLHPMVTVEDVEELFRNIGAIKYARLLRDGIAEVIFLNEMDAYRSVDVYHNRQLDGQPMNVMVMSKNADLASAFSSFSSYSPIRSRYSPPRPSSMPASRRSGFPVNAAQMQSRQNKMPKSVLRTAGKIWAVPPRPFSLQQGLFQGI